LKLILFFYYQSVIRCILRTFLLSKLSNHGSEFMTEKTTSKYLINLEKNFANNNPALLKSLKIFHELDQMKVVALIHI